jgi:hypothetical protein
MQAARAWPAYLAAENETVAHLGFSEYIALVRTSTPRRPSRAPTARPDPVTTPAPPGSPPPEEQQQVSAPVAEAAPAVIDGEAVASAAVPVEDASPTTTEEAAPTETETAEEHAWQQRADELYARMRPYEAAMATARSKLVLADADLEPRCEALRALGADANVLGGMNAAWITFLRRDLPRVPQDYLTQLLSELGYVPAPAPAEGVPLPARYPAVAALLRRLSADLTQCLEVCYGTQFREPPIADEGVLWDKTVTTLTLLRDELRRARKRTAPKPPDGTHRTP